MYRYSRFSSFASRMARSIAHPAAFLVTLIAVVGWLATGPFFKFSSTWQFVFSNVATIVTFVLLFLIQHTQSREMAAVQLKLNELIRATEGTHNALLDIEELTNRDYDQMKESYTALAQQAREQLPDGRVNWATARVQMEALDTMLDPEARSDEADENKANEASHQSPAILVIDDSEPNRTLLKRRLERDGYTVTTAEGGQEGLDTLAAQPFDMVLLDVMMAGMDGEQVLERMQEHSEWRDIPVIMITALDEQASVNRCLRLGARDYLLKPFDPVQLHAHIASHLRREPQPA